MVSVDLLKIDVGSFPSSHQAGAGHHRQGGGRRWRNCLAPHHSAYNLAHSAWLWCTGQ